MSMLEETYYLRHYVFPDPIGQREEWRVCRINFDEDMWSIKYNKAAGWPKGEYDGPWIWADWYNAEKYERQSWFLKMKKTLLAHTEPTQAMSQAEYLAGLQWVNSTPTHAIEEKPMRDDMYSVKTTASTINIAPAASATVTQKTDLQNQREYLQGRLNEVRSSFRYGTLHSKMSDAFAIDIDNTPKTAKELIDGIKSGKFTLDENKMAVQDVAISTGDEIYDRDEDVYVYPRSPLYAMNWGGLSPDRVGYEKAKASFEDGMKAAADTIMIGDPTSALAAIQALEAWTPPAAAAAN